MSPRAVASVAHRAATEVAGVALVSRSSLLDRLGGLLPTAGAGAGVASAHVGGGSTTAIELRLAVEWPRSVAQVADEARRHVRSRVEDLTGYGVSRVDIVVDVLAEQPFGDETPG